MSRLFLILLFFSSPLLGEQPPRPFDPLLRSIGWVRAGHQGIGTGWMVDIKHRWLITNLHVVGEQKEIDVFFPVQKENQWITERSWYLENQAKLLKEGNRVRGKVRLRHEESDLVLIELEKIPSYIQELQLSAKGVSPSDRVSTMGNRFDAESLWNFTSGHVRQVGFLSEGYFWQGKKLSLNVPSIVCQLPIHPGDSGSALVNDSGEVVGIVSGIRWQANGSAIAIEVSEIQKLLAQAKKEIPEVQEKAKENPLYHKIASATVWIQPTSTSQRAAGWIWDRKRGLILTTSQAVGSKNRVDVLFPMFFDNQLQAEEQIYQDRLELRLLKHLVRGTVLANDPKRDLALIEVDSILEDLGELSFAKEELKPASRIHTVNHPSGIELLWLYSQGVLRQRARMELNPKEKDPGVKVQTYLLQLPQQHQSSGGALVNDSGEVVGLLISKESPQQQLAYAITNKEIESFLKANRAIWNPETEKELLQRCRFLFQKGAMEQAQSTIAPLVILKRDPSAEADREESKICFRRDEWNLSLKAINQSLKSDPKSAESLAQKAAILNALGKYTQAIGCATSAIEWNSKSADAFAQRGFAHLKLGRREEAKNDFDEAFWIEPNHAQAFWFRSQWWEPKDEEKADLDLTRAIECDPNFLPPLRQRALNLTKKKEYKRAISDYQRLLEIDPLDSAAYQELGKTWLAFGDEAKAITALISSLRILPDRKGDILGIVLDYAKDLEKRFPEDWSRTEKWLVTFLQDWSPFTYGKKERLVDEILKDRSRLVSAKDRVRRMQQGLEKLRSTKD